MADPYSISFYIEGSEKTKYFDMTFRIPESKLSVDFSGEGKDQEMAKIALIKQVSDLISGLTLWRIQALATPANEMRNTFDSDYRNKKVDTLLSTNYNVEYVANRIINEGFVLDVRD